jgi:hypothetical protein
MDLHVKKVWLAGAASFLLCLGWYFMLGPVPFDKMLSLPYLVVMPFVGAVGAYLSRRMGGSVGDRILSALFPVFTFVVLFAFRIVYGLFFESEPYTWPHFLAGSSRLLIFILVDGLLLVLGAWPLCRRRHLRQRFDAHGNPI